jgi:hypothetical protein
MVLNNGKICLPSVNISSNKCYNRLLYYTPFCDSSSITCSFSYSAFADNNVNENACIKLWGNGAKYEIKSCNILRNTKVTLGSEGTIFTYGNTNIEDSCILENNATYIFRQASSSYTITLSNCTVDSTSNNGFLTTKNTVTKSFILALNHISTENYHSGYDSAGYLTPIIQSPSPSKKQIQCCTCGKFLYQPRLTDFFSLTSVFIFNFIHPNPSNKVENIFYYL